MIPFICAYFILTNKIFWYFVVNQVTIGGLWEELVWWISNANKMDIFDFNHVHVDL